MKNINFVEEKYMKKSFAWACVIVLAATATTIMIFAVLLIIYFFQILFVVSKFVVFLPRLFWDRKGHADPRTVVRSFSC